MAAPTDGMVRTWPRNLLRLEGLAIFASSLYAYHRTGLSWWAFAAGILLPDLGMAGFLMNNRVGAAIYNLAHTETPGVMLLCAAYAQQVGGVATAAGGWRGWQGWAGAGLIWLAHVNMDRMFGFGLNDYSDWVVNSDVNHNELAAVIAKDEGTAPDPSKHPLLKHPRSQIETAVLYFKLPLPGVESDSNHLTSMTVGFLPTSRGRVTLRSAQPSENPKIEFNYLCTAVDRYVFRAGLRQLTKFMLGSSFGREYIAGESAPEDPVAPEDTDEKLDRRVAAGASTTWHPSGTCAMGKVMDSELRVNGVEGLRIVDASVFPVPLSAHIQEPVYALAEQAAEMIAGVV
ncbi:GMC oxidoreductase-domain-containing protein [Xylariaceae sp. FL0804]|nr:GMC oxidoreductase-domain-containing protein [Xylariaceae sp. FL0804]